MKQYDVDLCRAKMMELNRIILFDGVCNLCDGFVQFVIKRDHGAQFKFGALQSEQGLSMLSDIGKTDEGMNSVVYIRGESVYQKSKAVLQILNDIGGIWRIASIFQVVPTAISDWVYDVVAANRYRLFGKKEACMIPTPDLRARFIDN